ncbi:GyrI-like domain-containing protein [Blastococcus sp. TML/C7B]|nr:GyrI-like domain-containing protein [Blastococcus sp. TML/C7B]MBN1096368.1 GyrI-like domain-containing protein [Blastococcus sp. TML/C7B]
MTTGLIELSDHPPQTVAVVYGHVENSEYDDFLAAAFGEVRRMLADQRLPAAGPPFARYRSTRIGLDVTAGIPVDADFRPSGRVTTEQLPGGLRVAAPHVGDHDTVGFTYETLEVWMAGNNYVPAGDPWESFPDGAAGPTLVTMPCRRSTAIPRQQHVRP